MSFKICFASNNKNKLAEIRPLLAPDFSVLSLAEIGCNEDLPETSESIEGNAYEKARYVFSKFAVPCFADDTGLEVAALNGQPGVYSARYAGEAKNSDDNIALLLANLRGQHNRRARFRTVIALVGLGKDVAFEGVLDGEITLERKGHGGFGYDPVFQPLGSGKTLAEMDLSEKNRISHRALAVRKLIQHLRRRPETA